ncbi:unnamed protein product [Colias eurytheme]|nr:unnamed protein product [Colias eurytheme]
MSCKFLISFLFMATLNFMLVASRALQRSSSAAADDSDVDDSAENAFNEVLANGSQYLSSLLNDRGGLGGISTQ